jgi:hypothetical protein
MGKFIIVFNLTQAVQKPTAKPYMIIFEFVVVDSISFSIFSIYRIMFFNKDRVQEDEGCEHRLLWKIKAQRRQSQRMKIHI